ncbi:MAG: hypothetical protein AAFR11_00120 [Pseudomonadota bacterium]
MIWLIAEMWISLAAAAALGGGLVFLLTRPWAAKARASRSTPEDWEAERRRLMAALAKARRSAEKAPQTNGHGAPTVAAAAADLRAEIGALRRELAGAEAEWATLAADAATLAAEVKPNGQATNGVSKSEK